MTETTLSFIHQSYQEALKRSENIIQILENLYDILADAEVSDEDSKTYDVFIDGLRNCLRIRKMTAEITDTLSLIVITILYIVRWLNDTKQIAIDIDWNGRRKSLESDLTKLLRKSNQTPSAKIKDRFGLKGEVNTNKTVSEEQAISYIYVIADSIIGILAAKDRKQRKEFLEWIESSGHVNRAVKATLLEVLNIPFDVDDHSIKDYIKKPKENGYQSYHFTLTIQPYSDVLPGIHLEIQLRTTEMEKNANSGNASHQKYKEYHGDNPVSTDVNPLTNVFVVDDFSQISIPGFTSYKSEEDDKDGIHFPKKFGGNRRISNTLAPSNTQR